MKTIAEVQAVVAARYHLTPRMLKGIRRAAGVTRARMVAMYLCRRLTGASYPEIARAFGGLDHTTVINGCKRIHEHHDPAVQAAVAELVEQLGGDPTPAPIPTSRKARLPAPQHTAIATTEQVVAVVCAHFGVRPEILRVAKPNRRTIYIRAVAIYLARELALAPHAIIRAVLGVELKHSNLSEAAERIRWSASAEVRADVTACRTALLTGATPTTTSPAAG